MPYHLTVSEEFVKKNLSKNLEKENIGHHVVETSEGFHFTVNVGSHEIPRIKKLVAKAKKRIIPRIPKTPKKPTKELKKES